MIYLISSISAFLSGLGVGGGSLFILLATIINIANLDIIRAYNLLMYISLGASLAIKNKKTIFNNGNINKIEIIKIIILLAIGSIIGTFIGKNINEKMIKIFFNVFMLFIGIYEIISSVKCIKNEKILV